MRARQLLLVAAVAIGVPLPTLASPDDSGSRGVIAHPLDQVNPAQRERIWGEIEANRAKLPVAKSGGHPLFEWPLRPAQGYSDPGYETMAYFVDHDPAYPDHVKDYNCGSRTYDNSTGLNHPGTDIGLMPDNWAVMDAREVEIIAAAAGTIVYKSDGNFDHDCDRNLASADWNAVYVQHDDGSMAWYGHMKSGSLTPKPVGARVAVGEFLGNVGSSGYSTAPHLHFEVYDSRNNLVDPFAGACNNFNADSWWASQPPYLRPKVNRVIAASRLPVDSTCRSDGRLQDPGTINAVGGFVPGGKMYFVAFVRDLATTDALTFTIHRPDGSVWDTFNAGTLDQVYSSAYFYVTYTLESNAPTGTWLAEAKAAGTTAQVAFAVNATATPPANYTDIWWNAAESGWGINFAHQSDDLFATWFTYGTDHTTMWLVADTRRQSDGSFTGPVYRTTGTPLAQINGQPAMHAPAATVGSATIRFATSSTATLSYTVDGIAQQKSIMREPFSTPTTCVATAATRAYATNFQDLWWNPSESGWGINLAHQGDTMLATWFTYGADGLAHWLVGPDVVRQPTGEFTGQLYRTTGTPFNQINGAVASATVTPVGSLTFTFTDGEHARMDYTVDGVAQSKSIVREVFGAIAPLCR